jgi:hypothetical protein
MKIFFCHRRDEETNEMPCRGSSVEKKNLIFNASAHFYKNFVYLFNLEPKFEVIAKLPRSIRYFQFVQVYCNFFSNTHSTAILCPAFYDLYAVRFVLTLYNHCVMVKNQFDIIIIGFYKDFWKI